MANNNDINQVFKALRMRLRKVINSAITIIILSLKNHLFDVPKAVHKYLYLE